MDKKKVFNGKKDCIACWGLGAPHTFDERCRLTQSRNTDIKKKKGEKLLLEIGKFLKSEGFNVLVLGNIRVEQRSFSQKYKFEFVVDFVGKKLKSNKKEKK